MGCDFDLTFVSSSVSKADQYFTRALTIAMEYEDKFSRFKKNSELSLLNKYKSLAVSGEFLKVYKIAKKISKKTEGRFNVLEQVSSIGYNTSFEKLSRRQVEQKGSNEYNNNLSEIKIRNKSIYLKEKQSLDFGGFLKGLVVQDINRQINNKYGSIINIGGDLYVSGLDPANNKFKIEIINPLNKNNKIIVDITNTAICTSGVYKRKWKKGNINKHHILNPNYKDSAETDILSASIFHKNGALADAYATMSIVMKSKRAINFLNSQKIPFVIITKDAKIISKNIRLKNSFLDKK